MPPAAPTALRTEYHHDPLGLDETEPRFSWLPTDDRRGAHQSAYQVLVASSLEGLAVDDGDRWDSGRVVSADTAHIVYDGAPLGSFDACVWKVRTWDAEGEPSPWSETARFELGPLVATDWRPASPIQHPELVGGPSEGAPAPYLRHDFAIDGAIESARLYITALGLYEATINGRAVTADVYRPGWTDYDHRVPFQAYDVTGLLRTGDNAIGAILGDGWYAGMISSNRQNWGDRPRLLALLRITLVGRDEPLVIATDGQWRTSSGAILQADNYLGETYDARLEPTGWDEPGFDDDAWVPAEMRGNFFGVQTIPSATIAPPARRVLEVEPVDVTQRAAGTYRFDLGTNMVGWIRLRISAPAGTELTLGHAEMLEPDGSLHTENLRLARATDTYICRGEGEEAWEPRFTFHGFRYCEVSGVPEGVSVDAGTVTGIVVHSDAAVVGDLTCSNPYVEQLQRNILSSQRGNFLDVPTDCPQRSERLGWTGDIQMFARTATFNMDAAAFLTKYTMDLRDAQLVAGVERGSFPWVAPSMIALGGGPAWADAGVIVPWVVYERYGDVRVLDRHYRSMLDYIDFLDRADRGRAEGRWMGFGDWLSLDADGVDVGGWDDRFGGTSRDYLWRAFDAYSTGLTARTAELLGRLDDAARLRDRRERVLQRFIELYVGGDGHLTVRTQTAYLVALHFGLLDDPGHRAAAIDDLVSNIEDVGRLQTGFVGTPYLLHVLSDIGRADLAYRLLEREEYPGWLYPVLQGATTIWERWDAWTKDGGFKSHGMNSFNHYAYGAVGEWLFRVVAGIDTTIEGPGYAIPLIRPQPGGTLTSAGAHVDTIRGRIATSWELEGDTMSLDLQIPSNTVAVVRLPAESADAVTEDGVKLADVEGVTDVALEDGRVTCRIAAGTYRLSIDQPIVAT